MKNGKAKNNGKRSSLFYRTVPLYYFVVFSAAVLVFVVLFAGRNTLINIPALFSAKPSNYENAELRVKRLDGLKFIMPLLSAKPSNEYSGYSDIKSAVSSSIRKYKEKGILKNASMYILGFEKMLWTSVNESEKYLPGSILKIPVLITYLKMEEEHPGTLDKKYTFSTYYQSGLSQDYTSKHIDFGKSYTVRQLLEYMIEYSDNNANLVLMQNIDWKQFCKLFNDLSLPSPDPANPIYYMTVRECSRFMEILFNSTYLHEKNSEYAIDLLIKSNYTEGIVKGIPESDLIIANKFGEAGTDLNYQLHETAILYIANKPYLISLMTLGNDNVEHSKLAEVIREMSGIIYEGLVKDKS
jgi:beta-lactamase class A